MARILIIAPLVLALQCAAQNSKIKASSSPIAKVVTLITEMKETAQKDTTADQTAYDKYSCWSLTNEKAKRATIKTNTENVKTQEAIIAEASGTIAKLSAEIKGLIKDIEEDKAAIATANTAREKEYVSFQAEEADMKQTIGLLGQAVKKLSKVQLMQKQKKNIPEEAQAETLIQVRQVVNRVHSHPMFDSLMQRDLYEILGSLQQVAKRQGSTLEAGEAFLPKRDAEASLFQNLLNDEKPKPNKLKGAAAGAKSYNSRSGGILGILDEMKDEFVRDLSKAQKEDFTALVNFQNLNAAKTAEISAATKQKEMKEGQVADLQAKISNAKESLSNSKDAIAADTKFLKNLLKNRKKEDQEFVQRTKTRNDEITALGKTIEILTSDATRTLFSKTISFLQTDVSATATMKAQQRAQKKAMQHLMALGRKHKNLALVSLAVTTRLDAFTKVKQEMNKMLVVLKTQQKSEYAKWEQCKKEIDSTEDAIWTATNTKKDLAEKRQDLVNTLSALKTAIDELKAQDAAMSVQLKKAGEQRKKENLLYQTSLSDQKATVAILNMALGKLKAFYSKGSFVETSIKASQPLLSAGKPETNEYAKNDNAGVVMQLMAKIISDAEVEAQELAMSEADAQKAYAQFVSDTTSSIETARAAIAAKEKQSAAAKAEKSETEGAQIANKVQLEKLQTLLKGTHKECDWLIKHFDTRQKARSEEMEAIGEAKSILSGATFK